MTLATDPAFFDLLAGSYRRLLGEDPPFLDNTQTDAARWLYEDAPACVLAHNTEPDPRFIYANKAAQALLEYSWDEIVALPSRFSAEAPNRAERQRLLDAVARDGFATGYSGGAHRQIRPPLPHRRRRAVGIARRAWRITGRGGDVRALAERALT
jgi:hypothetical protein